MACQEEIFCLFLLSSLSGITLGWQNMCSDERSEVAGKGSVSHSSYPDYTSEKHCQCNLTVDLDADLSLLLQLYRQDRATSGCSPRLLLAVLDRQMQEASQLQDVEVMGGILRPSVAVCPMSSTTGSSHAYMMVRSHQTLSITFQNPSSHMAKFYLNYSASPDQQVRINCGPVAVPPPLLLEAGGAAVAPPHQRGSAIGAIVACSIIGAIIIVILIVAYCKVKQRNRNRRDSTTIINKNKQNQDNSDDGKGNLAYEGTPKSSVGDVRKSHPLQSTWSSPSQPNTVSGMHNDLIPHDFMKRIASTDPSSTSPRQVQHYHHEPATVPVMSQPIILPPTSSINQPGYPHEPIMDPLFAEATDRVHSVSFPDEDSFDSPYTKPIPGSPSMSGTGRSDSGYTGSDAHMTRRPSYQEESDTSGYPDEHSLPHQTIIPEMPYTTAPAHNQSMSDDSYDLENQESQRSCTPDLVKRMPLPLKEYPEKETPIPQLPEQRETPDSSQRNTPDYTKQYPTKRNTPDYAKEIPILRNTPDHTRQTPIRTPDLTKQYPSQRNTPDPTSDPITQLPAQKSYEPSVTAPAQKTYEPISNGHIPQKTYEPDILLPAQKTYEPAAGKQFPGQKTYTPEPSEERGFTPDPIKQFRPISPEAELSQCASPADSMMSDLRTPTPMGRSPYPGMQSPFIPGLIGDDQPYIPPSPWRIPFIYKKAPLMYIDDTDTESVISSMSTRDLYVRSHKECLKKPRTPVMRDPYHPSYSRMPAQYRPETITETDV